MSTHTREVPQAQWAADLNTLGRHMGCANIVPMNAEQLLADAVAQTGLSDFGDDGFREGLDKLVTSLNEEAQLNLTGRLIARTEISRLLHSRLQIVDAEKKHPEISDEEIVEPLFIVGMGRTGSSILYECFMQDPTHRAPVAWEKKLPAPPLDPQGEERGAAHRIEWIEAETRLMYQVDESLVSKHEAHARLPEECSQLLAHEFQSGHFFSRNHVPSYAAWNAMTDVTPALAMHKRILQLLQWRDKRSPKPRWILKYGGHMGCMPQLFATYPDAKVIHTHRDPAVVVQSMVSLVASLRLMRSDRFNPDEAAEQLNAGMARGLEKLMGERQSGVVPAAQIADIHFNALMRDPLGTIATACEQLGMSFSDEARQAVDDYLTNRPRDKHGKHVYAYANAVDLDRERSRFAHYVDHYSITREAE